MLNARLDRTPTTWKARLITVAALLAVTLPIAAAQSTFASFSGSILDPMNALLPNVAVVLTNLQNNSKYEVRSDRTGRFEFVGLPPGDYQLETTLAGFENLRGTLRVSSENLRQDMKLEIGSLQETISVTGKPGQESVSPPPDPEADRLREERRQKFASQRCPGLAAGTTPIGGNLRPPLKLRDVRPVYPAQARDARVGGRVLLSALIGADGFIREVQNVSTDAPADLVNAATDAVRQWEFSPTLLNCAAVEVKMNVNISFAIAD